MIHLTAQTQILVATKPADFRCQIDGLVALCKNKLAQQPNSGTLFVFINRAKTMIRILHHDGNGYWLATKRLSRGKYSRWPSSNAPLCPLAAEQLMRLIRSIDCK